VATIGDLFAVDSSDDHAHGLIPLSGISAVHGRVLTAVGLVESPEALSAASADSVQVMATEVARSLQDYQVDVAVRTAAARGVAVLVVPGVMELPATATHMAVRSGIVLASCRPGISLAQLLVSIDQRLRGDASVTVGRALAAIDLMRHLEGLASVTVDDVVETASRELGVALSIVPASEGLGEPVEIDGVTIERLVADRDDDAVRLVLPTLAAILSRLRRAERDRRRAPDQARGEVVAQILLAGDLDVTTRIAERARSLGVEIDARHGVIAVAADDDSPSGSTMMSAGAELSRRSRREDLVTRMREVARGREGWVTTALEEDVLIVLSGEICHNAESIVSEVLQAAGGSVYCGVGTVQSGATGLRLSASEARSALGSSRARGRLGEVVRFDATGVRRVLADVRASWVGRRVLDDLLAPIDALDQERSRAWLDTLAAYLDSQGSLKAVAGRLHLHPNAVGYRIRRIEELLGMDLSDPDVRFALHLACRVRFLDRS
jgi:sugar diacid utilization regulator